MKNTFLLLLFFSIHLQAQQDTWEHYYRGDFTNDILETTSNIWIATNVGLVKIDKATNQRETFNIFNSDLNNHYIRSVLQDHDGMIWIKTNVGISKFDGSSWIHFTPDNSILEHDDTDDDFYYKNNQLFVDGQNRLWTKNNNRLLYYANDTWTVTYETDYLIFFQVSPNGSAWLRHRNGGFQNTEYIKRFDGTNWILEDGNLPSGINPYFTHMITFDSQDNLWFSISSSVNVPETGFLKWSALNQDWTFFPKDTLISFDASGITVDKNNNVWGYSAEGDSFVKFSEPNTWEVIPVTDTIDNQFVNSAIPTDDGIAFTISKAWQTPITYLGFVNNQNQVEFFETPSYQYERTGKMQQLNDGSIFIGNMQAHPMLFSNSQFESIDIGNAQLTSDQVFSILGEDSSGKKYFNSDPPTITPFLSYYLKKFSSYDGQIWNTIDYPNNITGHARLRQNGEILMAGQSNDSFGIYVYKNNTWGEMNTQAQSFYDKEIAEFRLDNNDNIWLTTEETGTLSKLENDTWMEYNYSNYGLTGGSHQIYGFDEQNQIWIDQRWGFNTFSLSNTTDSFELKFNDISILFDVFTFPSYADIKIVGQQDGDIFFMKFDRFFKYDGTDFLVYDTANSPIPFGTEFYNIRKDSSDNIWLASNHGVFKFDGDSEWKNFTPYNSPLADMVVKDVFIDAEQNIWMANFHSGIYVLTEDVSTSTISTTIPSQLSASIYPNPFSTTATISFDLEKRENVQLEIIDLTGRVVKNIFSGKKSEGNHQIEINLPQLTQGIYFCKVIVGNQNLVLKFVKY